MRKSVRLFKIIDIAGQSVLFIAFAIGLSDENWHYEYLLYVMGAWQLLSSLITILMRRVYKLKKERWAYLIVLALYIASYIYAYNIKDKYAEITIQEETINVSIFAVTSAAIGLLVAFWYYTICFREINRMGRGKQVTNKKPVIPMKPSEN